MKPWPAPADSAVAVGETLPEAAESVSAVTALGDVKRTSEPS